MSSLFQNRVLNLVADDAASLSGVSALKDPEQARRASMALAAAGFEDIPSDARKSIERAQSDRKHVLDAFWNTFRDEVPPNHPVRSRLWVNPPRWMNPDKHPAVTDHTWCRDQDRGWLVEARGTCFCGSFRYDDTVAASFDCEKELKGFYDAIVVFPGSVPDGTIDVAKRVLPGTTTITIVRPSEQHGYWAGWADINTDAAWFLQRLEDEFNLVCVDRKSSENVEFVLLGVEAK